MIKSSDIHCSEIYKSSSYTKIFISCGRTVTIPEGWEDVVTHSFKRILFIRTSEKYRIPINVLTRTKIFLFAFGGKTISFTMARFFFWECVVSSSYDQNISVTHSALGNALTNFLFRVLKIHIFYSFNNNKRWSIHVKL